MKICRKILSVISAAAVFSAMTVSVFANNVTTTVTYDISTGKANVVTSGTATAGKEVTHIVYKKGEAPSESNILYLDQATANETTGAFSFNYSIATNKLLATSVSVVGTDGDAISPSSTDVDASVKLNLTLGTGITSVTLTQNSKSTTLSASGAVYVQPGVDVTYTVVGPDKYTVNDKQAMGAYRTSYSVNTDVTVAGKSDAIDFTGWGTSSSKVDYSTVLTNDAKSAVVGDFSKPSGSPEIGNLDDVAVGAKTVTFYSTVNTSMITAAGESAEYGIIFLPNSAVDALDAATDGAYILPAYGYAGEGEWGICVIDNDGTQLTNYTARTYVKIGESYAYGTIVHK